MRVESTSGTEPLSVKDVVEAIPDFAVHDLELIQSHLQIALRIRKENQLSTESGPVLRREEEGLHSEAKTLLANLEVDLTQADMALLCSVVLSESYGQQSFTSRDINDIIEESSRPRVINITSPVSGLLGHGYLQGTTKRLSLSPEGRSKARDLVQMLKRQLRVA